MTAVNTSHRARIILAALVLILGAFWAGARFGPHQPTNVEALPLGGSSTPKTVAQRDAALTNDESINVRVYRQASPAVANILTKATEYDFFMDPVPVEGAGSGFVIDPRGYILTNFHVVEGAQSIEVVLGDQSHHPAKYIGADQRNDVALIKIDPKGKHLSALPLGDSGAIQVGQKVLAIGDPFGFQSTLTIGVAIPINTAKNIANDLMTDGRVHRAFLGVQTLPVGGWLAEALDLPVQEGLLIEAVTRGGPAAAAGLHGGDRQVLAGMRRIAIGGDVLVAIDDQKIASPFDMNVILNRKRPGDTVKVSIYRGGKRMDIPVKLGERTGN